MNRWPRPPAQPRPKRSLRRPPARARVLAWLRAHPGACSLEIEYGAAVGGASKLLKAMLDDGLLRRTLREGRYAYEAAP